MYQDIVRFGRGGVKAVFTKTKEGRIFVKFDSPSGLRSGLRNQVSREALDSDLSDYGLTRDSFVAQIPTAVPIQPKLKKV